MEGTFCIGCVGLEKRFGAIGVVAGSAIAVVAVRAMAAEIAKVPLQINARAALWVRWGKARMVRILPITTDQHTAHGFASNFFQCGLRGLLPDQGLCLVKQDERHGQFRKEFSL